MLGVIIHNSDCRAVVQLHISGILEARVLLQNAQDKTEKNWRQMRNLARNLAVKEEINSSKVIFENVKTSRIPMARKGYNELHHLAVTRSRNASGSRIPEFNRTDSSKTVTKETLDNCDEYDITADFNERLSLADFHFESTVGKGFTFVKLLSDFRNLTELRMGINPSGESDQLVVH